MTEALTANPHQAKPRIVKAFDRFHATKIGCLFFGLIELAIAYGFASVAIDRGSLWWYLLTLVFLVGALQNFIKFIAKLFKRRVR